jgi:hypothetical protein
MTIAAEKIPMKSMHLDLNTRPFKGLQRSVALAFQSNNHEMLPNVNAQRKRHA